MENKLEQKLQECEVVIRLFRRHLTTSQCLCSVLFDLYNLLGNKEAEKKPESAKKKVKEKEEK